MHNNFPYLCFYNKYLPSIRCYTRFSNQGVSSDGSGRE